MIAGEGSANMSEKVNAFKKKQRKKNRSPTLIRVWSKGIRKIKKAKSLCEKCRKQHRKS